MRMQYKPSRNGVKYGNKHENNGYLCVQKGVSKPPFPEIVLPLF